MPTTTKKKTAAKNRLTSLDNGSAAVDIEVPQLFELNRLQIKVVGVTPLLCANPSSMLPESEVETPPRGSKSSGKKQATADICRDAAYFDADGHCGFPNVALFSCILAAAELMKVKVISDKKERYPPSAASVIQEGMSFDYKTKLVKLRNPKTLEPLTESDYAIDMQRAVNQNTGGAIVAIRPRFDQWCAIFDLLIDTENMRLMGLLHSQFSPILAFAGSSVGLGAFRAYVQPKGRGAKRRAGGPYGKFTAAIVE